MPNMIDVAVSLIRNNPNMKNNQVAQGFLKAYDNNDSKAGEDIATGLLETYGLSKEDGINRAQNGLPGLLMGMMGNNNNR